MTATRGRLRVYLGMAPGVGKTYQMLEEAHQRRARGDDVVVGFVETYGRPATEGLLEGLEIVPRRQFDHRGVTIEEMDPEAILRRAPAIVLIDELAHTNAPGSPREKRWEDVEAIRDERIDVISTCNVQHLDSVADAVEAVIGAPVHERIPDDVLRGADEIELVDMTPARLRRRMRRGEVYPPDRASIALERFFTEPNLTALRDLSLRFVSGAVDAQLLGDLSGGELAGVASMGARVLVVCDSGDLSRRALRRASDLAGRLRAPLLAIVAAPSPSDDAAAGDSRTDELVAEVEESGAQVVAVGTGDLAEIIARVVREWRVSHLVLAQPRRGRFAQLVGESLPDRLLKLTPDLEVSLVGPGRRAAAVPAPKY